MFLNGFLNLTESDLEKPPVEVIGFYEAKARDWSQKASEQSRSGLLRAAANHELFQKFISGATMAHGGKFGDGVEDLAVFEAWIVKMALAQKVRSPEPVPQTQVSPVKKVPGQADDVAYQQYWKQFARSPGDSPAATDVVRSEAGGTSIVTPSPKELAFEGKAFCWRASL